jgi:two-component system sensor histidine kinase BarA
MKSSISTFATKSTVTDLPIIDWDLGTRLAGNNRQFAEEMLNLLTQTLPTELTQIKQAHLSRDYLLLQRLVHKLHGAICYCGVPRLKQAAVKLETALKTNKIMEVTGLCAEFEEEINKVLRNYL